MNDIPRTLDLEDVAHRIHDAIQYGYPREAQRILVELIKNVAPTPAAKADVRASSSGSFDTDGLRTAHS